MKRDTDTSCIHLCAYCGKEFYAEQPFSHIIPKQFFRRFKRGIANKESYSTYHQRKTQREPVEFLLCHECELVFCNWESEFAKKITNKMYGDGQPDALRINKKVKLGALSVLWRILHCWVVKDKNKQGTLNNRNVEFLANYDIKWLEILKQQRDFSREEANIFVIPIDCVKSDMHQIDSYKKYPGIMANVIFYEQGEGLGYYCIRCFAHKVIIFAYLTPAFNIPRDFSIHNETIAVVETIMPQPILDMFIDYSNDAKAVADKL